MQDATDTQSGTRRTDGQIIPPRDDAAFPPSKGVRWPVIKGLFENKKSCPHCHSRDAFHWKNGCPVLAELNLVCVEDATKAQAIMSKYTAYMDTRNSGRGGRGGREGRGGRGGQGGDDASSRRATTSERQFPTPPPPPPPTVPPVPPPADPPVPPPTPPPSSSQYPDTELLSDSDDDVDFIQNYGNLIDASGASISNRSDNVNATSTHYPNQSSQRYFLPFGGPSLSNKVALKWQRKIQNRRSRKRNASAQRTASFPPSVQDLLAADDSSVSSSVTSSIGSFAASRLNSPEACVFASISEEDECCADSGATDIMLPDYKAFISYRKCFHRFAILGDNTKLPILGEGTAVFSLNGKAIMV